MKKIPVNVWFYDCDLGQGMIKAHTYDAAVRLAKRDAGLMAQVRNVHRPTREEYDFRIAMGGAID